jgi:hypothetical protein
MANFHRLTVPSYFGGLPGGYDYINNATSGTPSNADGAKGSGVNAGTYFIAFGEDATSNDANRPAQALAQNTDYLDNLMRTDLVQVIRTGTSTVTGSPQTSIVLTGSNNIWLGSGGYTLQDLFHITDSNGRDIEVTGTKVVVSSISGGTVGGGFATANVSLTLNVGIPVGVIFQVYYCQRTNLATLPVDAMTLPFMRNALQSVDGSVVDFVAQISAPGTLGSSVTSLAAYSFETPDGTRLAKTNNFYLDCDPTDAGDAVRNYIFRTRKASVSRTLATLKDDPGSTLYTGLTGVLQTDTAVGYGTLGTFFFQDENLGSAPSGVDPIWALTSATSAQGDQFPRMFDVPVSSALGAVAPSLLHYVNGRWETTCGDGTTSFGDFNGANCIHAAIAYAASVSVTKLNIRLKSGAYTATTFSAVTGDVRVEGVSAAQTVVTGQISGGLNGIFTLSPGAHLWLSNISFVYSSGQRAAVYGEAGSALFADDCVFNDMGVNLLNPGIYNDIATLYLRRCAFELSTPSTVGVLLQFSDNNAADHQGFYFDNCSFIVDDEITPVRILGSSSANGTVSYVRFNACFYNLGGTATVSGHLTTNTGVLEVNANGGNNRLVVEDLTWQDCNVLVSTRSANVVLCRITPVALGDNSTSHLAIIGIVTIRGGNWSQSNGDTQISPFLIAANQIIVEDVLFTGTQGTGGGPSSEDIYVLDGNTYATADWAQFIFAPGAQVVTAEDNRLNITNCGFFGFEQNSNSGDIWIYCGQITQIDGITVTGYAGGGSGTVPNSRFRVQAGNVFNWASTIGYIRGLTMVGSILGTASQYTNSAGGEGGILMMMPTLFGTSGGSDQPRLNIESVYIRGFTGSSHYDDGIVLSNLTTYSGTRPTWNYNFIDCQVFGQFHGLVLYGVSGSTGNGNNSSVADNMSIIRGNYSSSHDSGIVLNPDYYGTCLVDGARCQGNGGYGFATSPLQWNYVVINNPLLVVVNCGWFDNLNSNGQAFFQSTTSGDFPHLSVDNNMAFNGGSQDHIRIQYETGIALPTTASVGNGTWWLYHAETTITGGATNTMGYANGVGMMENSAYLKTP